MEKMRKLSGWWVRYPYFFIEEPQNANDIVVEVHDVEANFGIADFYESEKEAWKTAEKYLRGQHDQAVKDIDFLSRHYTSPKGVTYVCPPELIENWKNQATKQLRIAEKGLHFCAQRKRER